MTEFNPADYKQADGSAIRFADSPKTLDEALLKLYQANHELLYLRDAVKGPDGYETWKDAAVDERLKRVQLERQAKLARYYTEFSNIVTCDIVGVIKGIDHPSSALLGTNRPDNSCFESRVYELKDNKVALVVFDTERKFDSADPNFAGPNVLRFCEPLGYPLFALVIDNDNMTMTAHTAMRPFGFETESSGSYNNFEINVADLREASSEDDAYERLHVIWAYISGYVYGHVGIDLEFLGTMECVWFLGRDGQFSTCDSTEDDSEASDETYAIKA